MAENSIIDSAIRKATAELNSIEKLPRSDNRSYAGFRNSVRAAADFLLPALFPKHIWDSNCICDYEGCRLGHLENAADKLYDALKFVLPEEEAEIKTAALIETLPKVKELIKTDVTAAYEGDPAAKSIDEILLAHPAFTAICIYRIAHELVGLQVPLVPRMLTEYAHEQTGIDIHPGAAIGPYFFIDHGTGVVIGETVTIGHHVKLYQNVTLGARSFEVGEDGVLVKGIKRHPDIGNNVVIYAGATILGGDTYIGDNCVIGGNVWLTRSVEPGKLVVAQVAEHKIRDMNPDKR